MKIALLNDTHFGARNDSPAFLDYFMRFYNEIFFPYLKDNNIKTLIHLGDVVDRRKFINFKTSEISLLLPARDPLIPSDEIIIDPLILVFDISFSI